MKSIRKLDSVPASLPLLADDILEFHAARLLLLLKWCGLSGRIDGLVKVAKLDFFVRYPHFFAVACRELGFDFAEQIRPVESSMVRYHYGPWDHRYYHVLAFLEGSKLIEISGTKSAYRFALTEEGKVLAKRLSRRPAFSDLIEQMKRVKSVLGNRSGSSIKKLIYNVFDAEVAKRPHGEIIH